MKNNQKNHILMILIMFHRENEELYQLQISALFRLISPSKNILAIFSK
jgi:penicillin-binding protein-related factor A (putative recombinase)